LGNFFSSPRAFAKKRMDTGSKGHFFSSPKAFENKRRTL